MAAFLPGILDAFAKTSPQPAATAPRLESDRQRDTPVGWAIAALRWSPKPSAVAAVSVGFAAAALRGPAARNWRRRAAGRARARGGQLLGGLRALS